MLILLAMVVIWGTTWAARSKVITGKGFALGIVVALILSAMAWIASPLGPSFDINENAFREYATPFDSGRLKAPLQLDSTAYIASWRQDGLGETATFVDGYITPTRRVGVGEPCTVITNYWFTLQVNRGGGWAPGDEDDFRFLNDDVPWSLTSQPNLFVEYGNIPTLDINEFFVGGISRQVIIEPGDRATLPEVPTLQIDGVMDGAFRVQLYLRGHVVNCLAPFPNAVSWPAVSQDGAWIHDGRGRIDWVKSLYQVGDEACIDYDVGYAQSLKGDPDLDGWLIFVVNMNTGAEITRFSVPDNDVGRVCFTVPADAFTPDRKDGVCQANQMEARLYNSLARKDIVWSSVTDVALLSPPAPTVTLDHEGKVKVGQAVSVLVGGEPNNKTQLPLESYHLGISPTGETMDSGTGTFTWQPTFAGKYKLQGHTVDEGCRPSAVTTKEVVVYDVEGNPPDDPDRGGVIPWALIVAVAVALIITTVVLIYEFDPLWLKALLAAVPWLAVLVLLWMGVV